MTDALRLAAEKGVKYVEGVKKRRVAPSAEAVAGLSRFREKFPEGPMDARQVVEMLDEVGSPATVGSTGGRYFGFVIGVDSSPPKSKIQNLKSLMSQASL